MKLNKLFTIGLLSMFVLASCDDAKEPVYNPAEPVANPDVYFNMGEKNIVTQLKDGQSSVEIEVFRKSAEGSVSYTLQASDVAEIYNSYPTEVTFADGQNSTSFTVGLDFEKVQPNVRYNITFSLPDIPNTDYYLGSMTYTCYYEPWKLVKGPNGETDALWRDNIIWGLFDLPESESEWTVTIEESPSEEGIFRIQNPYRNCEYLKGDVDTSDDLYIYFNIKNPNQVFFCDKSGEVVQFARTGVDVNPKYGELLAGSEANYALAAGDKPADDDYGKFRNGNLTWGTRKMLVAMAATGEVYYANTDGRFRIVWPGCQPEEDPANTWTTLGEAEFTDSWITGIIGEAPQTLPVVVQQNGANPDFYRLVDPFMYVTGNPNEGIFTYFDCTNHNNVLMPLQESFTGLSLQGVNLYATNYGEILTNWQKDPVSAEQIIAAGLNSTFDGTTIIVPAEAVFVAGNQNGKLVEMPIETPAEGKVVLPSAEQTTAFKKAHRMDKYITREERRARMIDDLFKGNIIKFKNVESVKMMK